MHRGKQFGNIWLEDSVVIEDVNFESRTIDGHRARCHLIGGVPAQLRPSTWIRELRRFERTETLQYIYDGIVYGFPIVDENVSVLPYDCRNYMSALQGPAGEFIDKLFTSEISEDKIILATVKPRCIHAIGAVPKGPEKF